MTTEKKQTENLLKEIADIQALSNTSMGLTEYPLPQTQTVKGREIMNAVGEKLLGISKFITESLKEL